MKVDINRIRDDIENIANITATPGNGCSRFSYSQEDKKARDYLLNEMTKLGLDIKIDGVGNIRATYANGNKEEAHIMIGSHIDTVYNGGKFDGVLGVVSALEVVRVIKENEIQVKNPIEIIIFAEEEGSNFGATLLGSKVLTGKYKLQDLKSLTNDNGVTSYQVIKDFGLNVDNIENQVLKKNEIKAMIELHVEQGAILDHEEIPVGIVESIAGMKTYKISLKGESNHAGSTPMNLRKDPMVGASKIISYIEEVAKKKASPTTVATVGKFHCEPNGSNVIPGDIIFYVDIRDVDIEGIKTVENEMIKKVEEVAKEHNLSFTIDLVSKSDSVNLSKMVLNTIEEVAMEMDYKYKKMNSGPVHDSVMLTEITEVGMIFVPSIKGKSHCPEEETEYEDIDVGTNLLLNTVIKLASK